MNDSFQISQPPQKQYVGIHIDEKKSLLQGIYYRATLTVKYGDETWTITDRSSVPYGAVAKVWFTYEEQAVADWYKYGGVKV